MFSEIEFWSILHSNSLNFRNFGSNCSFLDLEDIFYKRISKFEEDCENKVNTMFKLISLTIFFIFLLYADVSTKDIYC